MISTMPYGLIRLHGMGFDKLTLKLDSWHTPATDYPAIQKGKFRIVHEYYDRGTYRMHGVGGYVLLKVKKRIPVTLLQEQRKGKGWCTWMIDDPVQWMSMEIFAKHSKGKVLVAGLGLGLIVHALAKNKDVESITVVEKNFGVVRLVEPLLQKLPNLNIIIEDFHSFILFDTVVPYDTVIVDIWVSTNRKEKAYVLSQLLPLSYLLKRTYPNASISYHGFYNFSDIKYCSREVHEEALKFERFVPEY